MWKDYSKSYIYNNRVSSISIIAASFIAALFLSLLCSISYNFWCYDVEAVVLEDGDWHGRITGSLTDEDIETVKHFAGIKKAEINKSLSTTNETVVDLYFEHVGNVYSQMPMIIKQLGLNEDAASYHTLLLSKYFVNDPSDDSPPLLLFYYTIVLIIMAVSLILIIRNSFEITMDARVHQFGILSSIGATPKQIRTCLLQEAAALSMMPICAGIGMGILISFGIIAGINNFAVGVAGRHEAYFQYHPIVFFITVIVSIFTVLVSAWLPARKLSKTTPLEAIRGTREIRVNKVKHSRVLYALFGIEGELAGNALKSQKKALRISSVSLFLSFFGFCVMICFTTLSEISTNYTYFERYQSAWDVMITLKDTDIESFNMTQQIQEMDDVKSATVYQKAEGIAYIPDEMASEALIAHGGLKNYISNSETENGYAIKTPIIVLDDASFQEYCNQIGISNSLNGTVVLNRIWDSINSNFRNKEYIQFIKENSDSIVIYQNEERNTKSEVPILAYTTQVPVLREEYDNYSLVNFVSLSTWNQYLAYFEHSQPDSYIRILTKETPTLDSLNKLENRVALSLDKQYLVESENRIEEKNTNDEMTQGLITILGGFCILLATIGIANVFLNSLGSVRQRKREFARYMSIGLTPKEMKKTLSIEALVISGKPIIISLILTAASVQFMIRASYLEPGVFWSQAPAIPIILFAVFIAGTVSLAFYIGGKKILKADLNEALKSDCSD